VFLLFLHAGAGKPCVLRVVVENTLAEPVPLPALVKLSASKSWHERIDKDPQLKVLKPLLLTLEEVLRPDTRGAELPRAYYKKSSALSSWKLVLLP
jgi:hypothetical protein